MPKEKEIGLFTDYYELLMAQGVFLKGNPQAEFYSFYRRNPKNSAFAILSGVRDLLESLPDFRFSQSDISYLDSLGVFRREFLRYLENFSFRGDIWSFGDGDAVFPIEPVLKVRGTFCECALVETLILNCLNFSTCVATKSARLVESAKGKPVFEFAARRAPFLGSANSASYSAYVAGCAATSNCLAGKIYGIPVFGTMAHSWVMSFENELDAFLEFYRLYPDNCVFLVDTYDTLRSGLPNAMETGRIMRKDGKSFSIRIDSGDLSYLAKECRKQLDENGFADSRICLSNDLDENIISQLHLDNTPVDSFGVGTRLVDRSSLGFVYKMSRILRDGKPVDKMKISSSKEKATLPGSLQVHRFYGNDGMMRADMIEKEGALTPKDEHLLHHPTREEKFTLRDFERSEEKLVLRMRGGELAEPVPSASQARDFRASVLSSLHESHKRLLNPHIYKVSLGEKLMADRDRMLGQLP